MRKILRPAFCEFFSLPSRCLAPQIYPKIGATSVEANSTRIMMRFSKPVTYGHWANFILSARETQHNVTIMPDFEAG